MISTGELKKGACIELDGALLSIIDWQHIKMGRGSAQVRIKLKNLRTGSITEKTFQAGEKFPRATLDRHTLQDQYMDGDRYVFMDTETFDQVTLTKEFLDDAVNYLIDNMMLDMMVYEDEPISVELPITVDLRVTETEPGFKGDTAAAGGKPATMETGLVVTIPFFVNQGEVVRVDTRTGGYLERVSS